MWFNRNSSGGGSERGHEYVDLGLSVKWATCNIGVSSPEQRGDYFAWGETRTKNRYDWESYSMCRGSQYELTEYNTDRSYGRVDNRTILAPGYDVAKAKWGGRWRMPTSYELSELVNRCTWEKWKFTDLCTGVIRIVGPNGNCIFLPTTGEQAGTVEAYPMDNGNIGGYWSNTLDSECPTRSYFLTFKFDFLSYMVGRYARCYGFNVRAVI